MRVHLRPWQLKLMLAGLGICALLLVSGAGLSLLSQQATPVAEVIQPPGEGTASEAGETLSEATVAASSTLSARTFLDLATPTPEPTETGPPPTRTPMPPRTPAPSPTTTPRLTPRSSARLHAALRHEVHGDYEEAIAAYLAILGDNPTPLESRESQFHLAKSYLLGRQYLLSAAAWQAFLDTYSDDSRLSEAALMAARAYQAADQCEQAIPLLQAHLNPESTLADLGYEWIGDCHRENQDLGQAVAAYQQAVDVSRMASREAGLREQMAAIYQDRGQDALAVAEYDAVLDLALDEWDRARYEYLAGRVQSSVGQDAEGKARFRRVVDKYPSTEYAYLSLVELLDAGQEVDTFRQGLVGFHAGEIHLDGFRVAIRAFDQYLASESVPQAAEALFYKALAQRGLGNASGALVTLDELLNQNPDGRWLARASFEKAATLARLGAGDEAIKAYRHVAASFPSEELAPRALWDAAELREGRGEPLKAADLYQDLQAGFPGDERAAEALWRAGLTYYLAGDVGRATAAWRPLADGYVESPFTAGALYWLGKLERTEAPSAKSQAWDQLLVVHPYDYYGLRVAQIRAGESLTSTRFVTETVGPPSWDASEVRGELQAWLGTWTEVPGSLNIELLDVPSYSEDRHPFERVIALLGIGMRKEALAEADAMRQAAWNDPLALGRLAPFLHEQGLHVQAARSAIRLAGLWPEGGMYDAPGALQRLAYPLAYTELLSSEAQAWDLDPLLLAAIVRQESLFEPSAVSVAGARGLGQIMPATGNWIAGRLGKGDFVLEDLYRPSISIEFGAYYLDWTLGVFNDHILVTLAAYNGGPGNTRRWLEAAGYDLDLFVESMTAEESRRYLRKVYEGYHVYEKLYRDRGRSR